MRSWTKFHCLFTHILEFQKTTLETHIVPDVTRSLSPAVVESAILNYLKLQTDWTGYHKMIYRVSKGLRPYTYKNDGTKKAVFQCCSDLLKSKVMFRRKARIGQRSCCRKSDYKLPDQVRLNAVYLPSSFHNGKVFEILQPTMAGNHDGQAGTLASMRSRNLVPYST